MRIGIICVYSLFIFLFAGCAGLRQSDGLAPLRVSDNHRYFVQGTNTPFFWLGDTGWLLPSKLDRQEGEQYLEDRRRKGFNVIQLSVLHGLGARNRYGDSALVGRNPATPKTTPGNDPNDPEQYDYWDHLDYLVDLAASKNLYMGMGADVGQ